MRIAKSKFHSFIMFIYLQLYLFMYTIAIWYVENINSVMYVTKQKTPQCGTKKYLHII